MGYLALVPFPMLGQRLYLLAGNPYVLAHLEKCGYTGRVGYELFPETDTATAVKAIMEHSPKA